MNTETIRSSIDKGVNWALSVAEPTMQWVNIGAKPSHDTRGITTLEIMVGLLKVARASHREQVGRGLESVRSYLRSLNDDWAHPEALRAYLIAELLFSELGDTTSKEYQIVKSRINKYRYPEGGWGQIRDYKANIYETALTLYSKKKLSEDTALDQSALTKWQNRDGGWGFYQGELSNIICTALATAALARTDSSNRGAEWLLTHQKSDGSWGLTTETAQGTGQPNSIFIHSNTPWVILALTEEGMLEGEPIDRGVEALLRLQDPVGGWRVTSSFYWAENIRLSVWATGFAIFALGSMLEQVEALKLRRSA